MEQLAGEAYIRGIAAERFAVRNSGASAVVEGIGDHGCEYMTGGRVVVLGKTGRNFRCRHERRYCLCLGSRIGDFPSQCNMGTFELEKVSIAADIGELKQLIENHRDFTQESPVAEKILANWEVSLTQFIKVMPTDYTSGCWLNGRQQQALPRQTQFTAHAKKQFKEYREAAMGKPTGFKEFVREVEPYRDPKQRLLDYEEIYTPHEDSHLQIQGARCMDCGVPFCQSGDGCPVYNLIPGVE